MSRVHIIAASFLALTLLGIVGSMDYDDHLKAEAHYCAMVGQWKSDEALYVPPAQRRGWPDYRNEYEQVCMSNAERIDAYTMALRAGRE
jgi:hypothetical protein